MKSLMDIIGSSLDSIVLFDIGAMDEGGNRFQPLYDSGILTVVGFEPDRDALEALEAKARVNHRYHSYCLGDGKVGTLHLTAYPGCSSLYEPNPDVVDLFTPMGTERGSNFHVKEKVQIETTRLDDIQELEAPDILKLDIQGAELDVLRHGVKTLESAVIIESEVEFLELYKGQPLFGDMQVFMREQGFVLHKFVDVVGRGIRPFQLGDNRHAPISQLIWADAVFIRDFSALEHYSTDGLLKAALVLYDVYASFDLVFLLLKEYDRRQGTELSKVYWGKVSDESLPPVQFMSIKDYI